MANENKKDVLVSIVIPSYNRSDLLCYTLKSIKKVKKKTSTELEVIVVDDGSIDNPEQIIKEKFPWIRLFHQKNKGAPTARNIGVRKSLGKYILYLDSDDIIENEFFESKIEILESNPEIAGVYGPFDYFLSKSDFVEKDIVPRHEVYPIITDPDYISHLEKLLGGWYIPCNAILWRKEILEKVGGQNENLKINQDVDLMFRILVAKNCIVGVQSGRALIRIHDGERVGVIGESFSKLEDLYQLRRSFKTVLEQTQLDSSDISEALARYCFGYWVTYRKKYSQLANKFLKLSNEIYPKLNVRGHWYFVWLGKIAGKTTAVKFKDLLHNMIN